ncbi:tetraspanin-8 isoform X2 [Phascolarctos cinereus]|uniref:Tetraspanin n=1 Tax=Phascolarctos cinereus TaxID=38626 RepID=A0A6P5KJX9_PHACI|nr:tetraspanin-8 isoform X2 [Phascolarctos cinereus]
MSAVSGFIKYSMFIFNFIFWICGCVILGVSIYARVSKHGEELINEETSGVDIFAAVNLLIAVGTIIMVLGFLGCCGAMKESRCMLLLIEESFKKNFQEQVEILDQDGTEYETFKNDLDAFQKKFKCCGLINGAADWGKNFDKYSASCECTNITNTNDVCVSYMGKQVYKETCGDYIINFLKKNLVVVAGVAFGVAVIEMLGLVFSMVLYCQIGKK